MDRQEIQARIAEDLADVSHGGPECPACGATWVKDEPLTLDTERDGFALVIVHDCAACGSVDEITFTREDLDYSLWLARQVKEARRVSC